MWLKSGFSSWCKNSPFLTVGSPHDFQPSLLGTPLGALRFVSLLTSGASHPWAVFLTCAQYTTGILSLVLEIILAVM